MRSSSVVKFENNFYCEFYVPNFLSNFSDITTKQYLKKTDVGKIEQAKATWLHHFYGICCSEVRSKFTVEEDYSKKKGSRDAVGQLPIRRREEDTV